MSIQARILVIDDHSQELQSINQALSAVGGLETHGVNHGDAAFEHLETSPRLPDLILLDSDMLGMSGFEVLAGLKMDQRWSSIPVILMTSGAGNDEEQGLEMGAADFVQKPIQPGGLVVRVHHQLKQHWAKMRAQQVGLEAKNAETVALQELAKRLEEKLHEIQMHWDNFQSRFGNEPEICSSEMSRELPALLQSLRADVTRVLRLAEGV